MTRSMIFVASFAIILAGGSFLILGPLEKGGGNDAARTTSSLQDPFEPGSHVGKNGVQVLADAETHGSYSARNGNTAQAFDDDLEFASQIIESLFGGDLIELKSLNLLIEQLDDETSSLIERRKAAWALAQDPSPQALAALHEALATGPPYLRATIAEALGHFLHPQALEILADLLKDKDDVVARGAVRGLAASDDADAIDLLSRILKEDSRSDSVRAEAAIGLAKLDTWESTAELVDIFDLVRSEDNDLAEAMLEGLGTRPFSEVGDFYADLINRSGDSEVKATAIESLSVNTTTAVHFLLQVIKQDEDPNVRAAAAWALGTAENQIDVAQDLVHLLKTEEAWEVRRNIYTAVDSMSNVSLQQFMKSAIAESEPDTRLQAFGAVARLLSTSPNMSEARKFNSEMLPELLDIALTDRQLNRQIDAFNALTVANTDTAHLALRAIADAENPVLGVVALQEP